MKIDLHLHSSASDGALAPADLVGAARAGGLDVIALTDHDTIAGVPAAQTAAGPGITVIPGIEISSTRDGVDMHLLGYGVDPESEELRAYGDAAADARRGRMHRMIARLRGLGVTIEFEEVVEVAGPDANSLGRPHLARALVDRGDVRSFAEAFDRFLADDKPAFVPTELPGPRAAIALIHAAGGIAVWAHPPMTRLEDDLPRFVDWGLDGIECIRPHNTASATRRLAAAARVHGLLITGGSDWHGDWHGTLGSFHVTPADVADFLARAGI